MRSTDIFVETSIPNTGKEHSQLLFEAMPYLLRITKISAFEVWLCGAENLSLFPTFASAPWVYECVSCYKAVGALRLFVIFISLF